MHISTTLCGYVLKWTFNSLSQVTNFSLLSAWKDAQTRAFFFLLVILPQPPRLYLAAAGCEEGQWCCLSAAAGTARTRGYLFAPKFYNQGTSIHQRTPPATRRSKGKGWCNLWAGGAHVLRAPAMSLPLLLDVVTWTSSSGRTPT